MKKGYDNNKTTTTMLGLMRTAVTRRVAGARQVQRGRTSPAAVLLALGVIVMVAVGFAAAYPADDPLGDARMGGGDTESEHQPEVANMLPSVESQGQAEATTPSDAERGDLPQRQTDNGSEGSHGSEHDEARHGARGDNEPSSKGHDSSRIVMDSDPSSQHRHGHLRTSSSGEDAAPEEKSRFSLRDVQQQQKVQSQRRFSEDLPAPSKREEYISLYSGGVAHTKDIEKAALKSLLDYDRFAQTGALYGTEVINRHGATSSKEGNRESTRFINPYHQLRDILGGLGSASLRRGYAPSQSMRRLVETLSKTMLTQDTLQVLQVEAIHLVQPPSKTEQDELKRAAQETQQYYWSPPPPPPPHFNDAASGIIEIGEGQLAASLAFSAGLSIVTLIPQEHTMAYLWEIKHIEHAHRPAVVPTKNIEALTNSFASLPQVQVGAVFVTGLATLTDRYLPSEIPLLLANTLSFSGALYVTRPSDPKALEFWGSLSTLVDEIVAATQFVDVDVTRVTNDIVRITVKTGVRKYTPAACKKLRVVLQHVILADLHPSRDLKDSYDEVHCFRRLSRDPTTQTEIYITKHKPALARSRVWLRAATESDAAQRQEIIRHSNGSVVLVPQHSNNPFDKGAEASFFAQNHPPPGRRVSLDALLSHAKADDAVDREHVRTTTTTTTTARATTTTTTTKKPEDAAEETVGNTDGSVASDASQAGGGNSADEGAGVPAAVSSDTASDSSAAAQAPDAEEAKKKAPQQTPWKSDSPMFEFGADAVVSRVHTYSIPFIPLSLLLQLGLDKDTKTQIFRTLHSKVSSALLKRDRSLLGHPDGILIFTGQGATFAHVPANLFSFRGSLWFQAATARVLSDISTLLDLSSSAQAASMRALDTPSSRNDEAVLDLTHQGFTIIASHFLPNSHPHLIHVQEAAERAQGEKGAVDANDADGAGSTSSYTDRPETLQLASHAFVDMHLPLVNAGDASGLSSENRVRSIGNARQAHRQRMAARQDAERDENSQPHLSQRRTLLSAPESEREHPTLKSSKNRETLQSNEKKTFASYSKMIAYAVASERSESKAAHAGLGSTDDTNDALLTSASFMPSVFAYGQSMSLVSVKLARSWRNATFIVMPASNETSPLTAKLTKLKASLSLHNMALIPGQLDPHTVHRASLSGQVFRFQFLGKEIFDGMLLLGFEGFLRLLGQQLVMARDSFLQPLDPNAFAATIAYLHSVDPQLVKRRMGGLVEMALAVVGVTDFKLAFLTAENTIGREDMGDAWDSFEFDGVAGESEGDKLLEPSDVVIHVQIYAATREILDCDASRPAAYPATSSQGRDQPQGEIQSKMLLHMNAREASLDAITFPRNRDGSATPIDELVRRDGLLDDDAYVALSTSAQPDRRFAAPRSLHIVTLDFLLSLPLGEAGASRLFEKFLGVLPSSDTLCPSSYVYQRNSLVFMHYTDAWDPREMNFEGSDLESEESVSGITNALFPELVEPFSFVEWGSGKGNVSMRVAQKFDSATVVSFEGDSSLAHGHWDAIKAANAMNNIVGKMPTTKGTMEDFYNSPEMFRYQFVSWRHLASLWSKRSGAFLQGSEFDEAFGYLIVNAVTTFVQLPSPDFLSAALMMFFPDLEGTFKGNDVSYTLKSHPSPHYAYGLHQSILDTLVLPHSSPVKLAASVVESRAAGDGSSDIPSFSSIIRVDIRNSSHQVDHHFQFRLDGHERKYQQHIVSTSNDDWQVYLIRHKDKFKIPYETVDALTLIALLRLNLISEIRDRFYDMLLEMGVYEDMAPWNIAFRGGSLVYIDYDTRDNELSKLIPMAYQLMAALMNLERTVKDFGHCPYASRNNYGIPFISSCVGSDFQGPCNDDEFPVPCGDGTCRETYIQCLQAINDLDLKRRNSHSNGESTEIVAPEKLSEIRERGSQALSKLLLQMKQGGKKEVNIMIGKDGVFISPPDKAKNDGSSQINSNFDHDGDEHRSF